ncbi:hypothetical protein K440DRAFT_240679 [Wilcoxina mikolae CBS 423.85]|nr:hypothetical protein K440DRAFT_240679 [Wilcoxina mikolae CBS 423.85]
MRCSPSALPMTLLKRWELPRLSSEKGPSRIELFQVFFVPEHWCPPYLLLTSWFLWAIAGSATIVKKVGSLRSSSSRRMNQSPLRETDCPTWAAVRSAFVPTLSRFRKHQRLHGIECLLYDAGRRVSEVLPCALRLTCNNEHGTAHPQDIDNTTGVGNRSNSINADQLAIAGSRERCRDRLSRDLRTAIVSAPVESAMEGLRDSRCRHRTGEFGYWAPLFPGGCRALPLPAPDT